MSQVTLTNIDGISYRTYKESSEISTTVGQASSPLHSIEGIVAGPHEEISPINVAELGKPSSCTIGFNKNMATPTLWRNNQEGIELKEKALLNVREGAYTHFISIPLNLGGSLTEKYDSFCAKALAVIPGDAILNKKAFNSAARLHLTVAIFTLSSPQEIARIQDIFQLALNESGIKGPFEIALEGLEVIVGVSEACKVLVIPPQIPKQLDIFSHVLLEKLFQAGFSKDLSVKWHCTLLNTNYSNRKPIDIRPVLRNSSKMKLGTVRVTEIHLSKLGNSGGNQSNRYYTPEHVWIL